MREKIETLRKYMLKHKENLGKDTENAKKTGNESPDFYEGAIRATTLFLVLIDDILAE